MVYSDRVTNGTYHIHLLVKLITGSPISHVVRFIRVDFDAISSHVTTGESVHDSKVLTRYSKSKGKVLNALIG
jgi:hypothetical protein